MNAESLNPRPLFFTPARIRHFQGLAREADYQKYFGDLESQVSEQPLADDADYLSGAAAERAFQLAMLEAAFPGKGFGTRIPPILVRYSELYPEQEPFGPGKLYSIGLSTWATEQDVKEEAEWYRNVLDAIEILSECDVIGAEKRAALLDLFTQDPDYLRSVYVYAGLSPRWAANALEHARHFKETGENRLAQKSLRLVEEYALWMRHFLTGEWFGRPGEGWHDSPGILFPESLAEAWFLVTILLAYDIVRPHLGSAEQQRIEQAVLRHGVETVLINRDFHVPKNNHQWGHNTAIGMVGFCLGDERYVDYALNGEHGFFYHVKEAVDQDGLQYESCVGYHQGCVGTYALLAESALNAAGIDLFRCPQLRSLFEAPLHCFFHDLSSAAVGDMGPCKGVSPHRYPGLFADIYGDRYSREDLTYRLYQALDRPEPRWTALPEEFYRGEKRFAQLGKTVEGCSLFADTGYTILRAPGGKINACLSWLRNNVGHSHPDGLSLVVNWRDQTVLPDTGHTRGYLDYLSQAWQRQTLAHNTVVINCTSQEPRGYFKGDWIQEGRPSVQARLRKFSAEPAKRLVRVEGDKLYPGWQLARTVRATDKHLVDVFEVRGSQNACLDYVLHVNGRLARSSRPCKGFSGQLGDDGGYELLKDVQVFENLNRSLETIWEVAEARFLSIRTRTQQPNTSVFWGEGPSQDGPGLPFLLVRCWASQTAFASMFVPFAEAEEPWAASSTDEDLEREAAAVLAECELP